MKIGQIVDKPIDQNEIESKYIWDLHENSKSHTINRINLSNFIIDYSWTSPSNTLTILNCIALPKNQIFVIIAKFRKPGQYLYISDAKFNIKEIKNPGKPLILDIEFISCFYDDSIFIFKDFFDINQGLNIVPDARRYIISQNKWVNLNVQYCGFPYSCVGFKGKIILAGWWPEIWIYDIHLDSYSKHIIRNFDTKENKTLLKISGKLYLLVPYLNKILYCDDPLLDWTLLSNYQDNLFCERASPRVYYHGSIYYFRRDKSSTLYEFSLSRFGSKATKLKGSTNYPIKL